MKGRERRPGSVVPAAGWNADSTVQYALGGSTSGGIVGTVHGLLLSLRPHQWVKNSLIFGGLIFSHSLLQWDAIRLSLEAFVIFCGASSGVYLLNDLCDLDQDRKHPTKRLRPLAAGAVSPPAACLVMVALLAGAVAGALMLSRTFTLILAAYVLVNVAYSFGLKRVAILDAMLVAVGFVLRAVAGAVVIGVQASPWLILCTLVLALVVAFGKRRHELTLLQGEAAEHRASLQGYSVPLIDLMVAISGATAVVTYGLYTMADETLARFGTRSLVLTTPFVLYGVLRYVYLVLQNEREGDPARLFLTDAPTLVNALLWVAAVCLIVYGPADWQPW